eukprot:NODE_567_length_6607_cov_0.300553.p1 type:complete len:342 gc:universal NODE_567_length_6607_cov_0.300553:3113-4138(+)
MSCCGKSKSKDQKVSDKESKNIDQQLLKSKASELLDLKLLLLGSGESGKSTVLKQIKLINKIQPTPQEIRDVANGLKKNAHQCICVLVEQAEMFEYEIGVVEIANRVVNAEIDDIIDNDANIQLSNMISTIWKDPGIQKTYARRSEYWLLDSTDYYLEHVSRFFESDFVPTEEDIVMARVMTTGIITTAIASPPITFSVVDVGGQRNERRKWIHSFDNVSAVMFLVNISGYDTVLFEDATQNRLDECYNLFQQTVNNPIFAEIPFYVLFNKKDIFESKIRTKSVRKCAVFEDYQGPDDAVEALKYLDEKFKVHFNNLVKCKGWFIKSGNNICSSSEVQERC